jgi:hypothetical protein
MMDALSRTGRVQMIAIVKRMLELAERPLREHTPRTRAESLSDHMIGMVRYARGYDPLPEPTREDAQAISDHYHLLLDENQRLRAEVAEDRTHARLARLVEECPALERWRQLVLDSPKQPALTRAAAWELTSIREELDGNGLDAEFTRMYAAEAIESATSKQKRSEVAA